MPDTTLTIRVDQALKDAFLEAAKRRNRNGSLLLRDFMQQYVAELEAEPVNNDPPAPRRRAAPMPAR